MYKILIIEDDLVMAGAIKKEMEAWGNEARYVEDFAKVLETFAEYGPHLVLLDITLPFYNGYHWCSEIRKVSNVPVIFISSAADNMNIIMAMNMGGDDFIAKPFDLNVLTAKVQAVLRRTYDLSGKVPMLEHRGAILNLYDTTLTYEGEKVNLTQNEFKILQILMENAEKIVPRDEIIARLWESDEFIDDNTLTVAYLSDDEYRRRYELDLVKEMAHQRKGNKIAVVYNHDCEGIEELADYPVQIKVGADMENVLLGLDFILFAQTIALMKSLSLGITPDNPCPTGEVNRVVKGVTLYPYTLK